MSSETIGISASDPGTFVGRIWRPDIRGPSVVVLRDGAFVDVTCRDVPTMSALLELDDPVGFLAGAKGESVWSLDAVVANSLAATRDNTQPSLLSPADLQVIKACGVTFAQSMVERVIEEQAAGDANLAVEIRKRVTGIVGDSLRNIKAGSPEAQKVKEALIAAGVWSQYLEVGIGPDAEVFTKGPVLSSVGWGADVGLHPISNWNNPEPEIVLTVNSKGAIKGAMLGNDVNLRDVEGRSALLLGKAKDNNASCALGPLIRLFDDTFSMDDVRQAELELTVKGTDGYELIGHSSMREISRDPTDLVSQTCGRHHQYPDGLVLFLGTLFAPTQDRGEPGQGFTHAMGDKVTVASAGLGRLQNTVRLSTECPEWVFGITAHMKNLAARSLL